MGFHDPAPSGSVIVSDTVSYKRVTKPIPGFVFRHVPKPHSTIAAVAMECKHRDGVCYDFVSDDEILASNKAASLGQEVPLKGCRHCGSTEIFGEDDFPK